MSKRTRNLPQFNDDHQGRVVLEVARGRLNEARQTLEQLEAYVARHLAVGGVPAGRVAFGRELVRESRHKLAVAEWEYAVLAAMVDGRAVIGNGEPPSMGPRQPLGEVANDGEPTAPAPAMICDLDRARARAALRKLGVQL